jgi:uncharacterized protein DUF5679
VAASTTASSPKRTRRIRRLEDRLDRALAQEQRRSARLERARTAGAAGEIKRRTRKLERTMARERRLTDEIAKLQGSAAAPAAAIEAYCLKDRAKVVMVDPQPTTMRTGQAAMAGRCPMCGGKVMRAVAGDGVR